MYVSLLFLSPGPGPSSWSPAYLLNEPPFVSARRPVKLVRVAVEGADGTQKFHRNREQETAPRGPRGRLQSESGWRQLRGPQSRRPRASFRCLVLSVFGSSLWLLRLGHCHPAGQCSPVPKAGSLQASLWAWPTIAPYSQVRGQPTVEPPLSQLFRCGLIR